MFRRYAAGLVSFVLATLSGAVIFAAPAQAATAGWPQDTTALQSDYIESAPNGSVVAGNCSDAATAIKVFSTSGATTATVPQRTDGLLTKVCGQSAIGKDGTVFGVASNNSTRFAVVAYKGTTKLWERPLPQYCAIDRLTYERAINRVLVGNDRFVYVVSRAHACYGTSDYLTKLNASTGQVVFERQLSRSAVTFFGATSKGLVAQDTARVIRFIGYNNTDFASQVTAVGRVQAADMNARAFTVDTSSDACSTSILKMYTPGTATPFSFIVPLCWQMQGVQATSQNGLAMLAYNQDGKPTLTSYTPKTGGGFNAASIVLPDTEGYRSFKAPYDQYEYASIQTDTNGNILLVRAYTWQRGDNRLTGWQFTLHSPKLSVVSEYDTSAFDFQQTTRFARSMRWALAKDRLYVSVGYCATADRSQCVGRSVKLYAARMTRLSMDYPRGAVLGVAATTPTCKRVTLVGARGSGEDPFAYGGLGEPVQHIKDRLVAAGLTSMEVVAVAYPATPVNFLSTNYPPDYADSVGDGVDALTGTLVQINRDCPQSQIVLVGYSQGAHATDGVRFLPVAIQKQIKAMVLLGDPLFNPALTTVNKGTFSTMWSGVWVGPLSPAGLPPRQFSTALSGKVANLCIANDIVCNVSPTSSLVCANMASCPHIHYKPTWTQQAATWVRSKVTS